MSFVRMSQLKRHLSIHYTLKHTVVGLRYTPFAQSAQYLSQNFYRARGLAIACMSSVCLSVTLVDCDHIGWKSWKWKLIADNQPNTFALRNERAIHLLPGEHGEILGRLLQKWGREGILDNKSGNISETCKDRGKLTMDGLYQEFTNALSNGTIPDPLRPPLVWAQPGTAPIFWYPILTQERVKLRSSNLAGTSTFIGCIRTEAH